VRWRGILGSCFKQLRRGALRSNPLTSNHSLAESSGTQILGMLSGSSAIECIDLLVVICSFLDCLRGAWSVLFSLMVSQRPDLPSLLLCLPQDAPVLLLYRLYAPSHYSLFLRWGGSGKG
jgi:hypothetical protein